MCGFFTWFTSFAQEKSLIFSLHSNWIFAQKLGFLECEFCENWDFRNVNFINFMKNEVSHMWILWKLRFQKCEFCEKIEISEFWILWKFQGFQRLDNFRKHSSVARKYINPEFSVWGPRSWNRTLCQSWRDGQPRPRPKPLKTLETTAMGGWTKHIGRKKNSTALRGNSNFSINNTNTFDHFRPWIRGKCEFPNFYNEKKSNPGQKWSNKRNVFLVFCNSSFIQVIINNVNKHNGLLVLSWHLMMGLHKHLTSAWATCWTSAQKCCFCLSGTGWIWVWNFSTGQAVKRS